MKSVRKLHTPVVLLLLLACAAMPARAELRRSVNPDNGLQGWHFSSSDVEIELIQRLPDQTRALFMNHEFSRAVIEQLALSCMFQTIIRNTGTPGTDRTVSVDLAQWRMRHDGNRGGILLKEPLLASWSDEQASPAARLVVRWGMFPTQQDFQPGDYNWGLTAYGIPPGSRFDLEVVWMEDGERLSAEIADIFCAPDVDRLQ
jgi:hypothetical protein